MSMPTTSQESYAPPSADAEPPAPDGTAAWRASALGALKTFGVGVLVVVLTFTAIAVFEVRDRHAAFGFAAAALVFAVGFVRGIRAFARFAPGGSVWLPAGVVVGPLLGGLVMAGFGGLLALISTVGFSRGRQLRSFGRVQLARVAPDTDWSRIGLATAVPADVRDTLAERWRWNARTEHASVAAFAQLTLDLVALGAPARLIDAANADAKDEIRHAELCFSLARAIDGRSAGPAPFPEARAPRRFEGTRTMRLARLAVDSLVDGVLHEGLSARVLAKLVKRCDDAATKDVLRELAADEGRHAAHAWDVVEWCLAEGGPAVAHALRGAVTALPGQVADDLPAAAVDGSWERYGIPGAELEQDEHAAARAQLTARVLAATGASLAA